MDKQDEPIQETKETQPKEAKQSFFFPPETVIEAETLEEATKIYQQKGSAKA